MNIPGSVRSSHYAFPLVAVIALLLLVISELSHHRAVESLDKLGQMAVVRVKNLTVLRLMVDAETGQRGYLLTGRKEYLRPYDTAIKDISRNVAELESYYSGDEAARQEFGQLKHYVTSRVSEMQETLALFQQGKTDAALQIVLSDIGREQMDAVRVIAQKLVERESQKISVERGEVYTTLRLGRLGVAAMTALSMLALAMYLRQRVAIEGMRTDQQVALKRERDQLEALALERTEQLTELARHLQTAREDERSRLARDLHDELGALLTAAKLDVARLKSRLPEVSPEVATRMAHLNDTLNSGIALKRRIIEDLRPSSLSNLGLIAALEIQAREFAEASGLKVETRLNPVHLSPSSELTAYRLVQEAVTNITKYARATEVHIGIGPHADGAEVSVTDNGIGFDTSGQRRATAHGLLGMRFRVEAEGGRMQLSSVPGQGTRISATLPAAAPPAETVEANAEA